MTEDEENLFDALATRLNGAQAKLKTLDAYYAGEQLLDQLGLAIPPSLRKFVTIVNWPQVAVDSVEERCDVEGFRLRGSPEADDDLWRVWQANNLDEESQLGRLDALVYGRGALCVGSNEDDPDTPIISVESPKEITWLRDPRTRKVAAALRLTGGSRAQFATLYLPDRTIWRERVGTVGRWQDVDVDEHGLGEVPVVPMLNRARVADQSGTSEMANVIPLTDAAARALTNLQLAQETHAVPQRWVLGVSQGDFANADGTVATEWQTYMHAFLALEDEDGQAKIGQFPTSDLRNFETVVNMYAQLVAGVTGLPSSYLGFHTDNPASADAIRAAEARLVKKCERRIQSWSGSYEQVMRLVRRLQRGTWDDSLKRLETIWRDPATPTMAEKADALVKLHQAGALPVEAVWEGLGYSQERREQLRRMRRDEVSADVLAASADLFRQQPDASA